MKKFLYPLAVVLTVASVAAAQKTDERPEYSRMYHLTVVYGSPMTEVDAKLHAFMRKNSVMKQLVKQTVYNEYTNDRKLIANTLWNKYLGDARPAVLLQGPALPNGKAEVIFYALGEQVDCSTDFTALLRSSLRAYVERMSVPKDQRGQWKPRCPDNRCPVRPPVTPPPPVNPPPVTPPPAITPIIPPTIVDVDVTPDVEEEPEEEEGTPLILFILTGVAAAAAGMYASQKKQDS